MPVDWDGLYCGIIAATGWTWEYIDDYMTLPRLGAMRNAWEIHPPLHTLVATVIGHQAPAKPKRVTRDGMMALVQQMQGKSNG